DDLTFPNFHRTRIGSQGEDPPLRRLDDPPHFGRRQTFGRRVVDDTAWRQATEPAGIGADPEVAVAVLREAQDARVGQAMNLGERLLLAVLPPNEPVAAGDPQRAGGVSHDVA